MSQHVSPEGTANLKLLLKQFPNTLMENIERNEGGVTVSVRFSMLSFPLLGGIGQAANEQDARSAALRSFAARLCELCIFNDKIIRLVEKYGNEAISVFAPGALDLFTHLVEFMTKGRQLSARARISKSWDGSLFPSERVQLTREMTSTVGTYWDEMWPELDIPSHMQLETEEDAPVTSESVMKEDEAGGQEYDPAGTPTTCCSELSRPGLPTPPPVLSTPELTPDTPIDSVPVKHTQTPCTSKPVEKRPVAVSPACSEPPDGKRARMAGRADKEDRVDRPGGDMQGAVQPSCPVPPEWAHSRTALLELASVFGARVEEDAYMVRFAGIDPAFVSGRKDQGDPYVTVVNAILDWKLINAESGEANITKYAPTLWRVLQPLVQEYGSGESVESEWTKRVIRDVGMRFWKQPRQLQLVQFPMVSPCDSGSDESACELLVKTLGNRNVSTVEEENDGLYRLHLLTFPVEMFGERRFVEKGAMFSSFVRCLCSSGLLPSWTELMYVLKGKHSSAWLSPLVSAVTVVIQHLYTHYFDNKAGLLSCGGEDQRDRVKACLEQIWKLDEATVVVPDACHSGYTLSLPVRRMDGGQLWRKGAPPLTDQLWAIKHSVSIFKKTSPAACRMPPMPVTPSMYPLQFPLPQTPRRDGESPQPVPPPSFSFPGVSMHVAAPAVVDVSPREARFRRAAESLCNVLGWRIETMADLQFGEVIYFSGIPMAMAYSRTGAVQSNDDDGVVHKPYERLMYRLRNMGLIPMANHGEVFVPGLPVSNCICCLFAMLDLTHNNITVPTVARLSRAFWMMAEKPHLLRVVEQPAWQPRTEVDSQQSFRARLCEFLLCKIAALAHTRLVLGSTARQQPMLWFRDLSMKHIGLVVTTEECPYYSLLRSVIPSTVTVSDEELDVIIDDTDKRELLKCVITGSACFVKELILKETQEYYDHHKAGRQVSDR